MQRLRFRKHPKILVAFQEHPRHDKNGQCGFTLWFHDCYIANWKMAIEIVDEVPLIVADHGRIVVDNGININIPSGKLIVCY